MYTTLLVVHNLLRWVVLLILVYAIIRSLVKMRGNRDWLRFDHRLRLWTVTLVHIQFLWGVILYFVSPLSKQFMSEFPASMSNAGLRHFGMEHTFMMIVSVVIITIASAKAKRKTKPSDKFRTMGVGFLIGLMVMLIAIPWPGSPLGARPLFRLW
ncbi:MAG: hypothetical protein AAFS00_03275 [Bacteroidota bacterium]